MRWEASAIYQLVLKISIMFRLSDHLLLAFVELVVIFLFVLYFWFRQ